MNEYQLGIIFAIGSISQGRMIFRHRDRYFLEQIQELTRNQIYEQQSRTGVQYVLKTRNIDIEDLKHSGWNERNAAERNVPILDDYSDFLRAYIEIHGCLDYSTRYRYRDKRDRYKALRLRIYGNHILISSINRILHEYVGVGLKSVQNVWNGKTACIYYASLKEIQSILYYISGEPCFDGFWKDADKKLRNPIMTE